MLSTVTRQKVLSDKKLFEKNLTILVLVLCPWLPFILMFTAWGRFVMEQHAVPTSLVVQVKECTAMPYFSFRKVKNALSN